MMAKSDKEWEELSRRIAQEVMSWKEWGALPEDARRKFWKVMETQPDEYDLAFNRDKWWSVLESGCPDSEEDIVGWQPHNNVAQALMVLDRIAETYHYGHSIFLLASHLTRYRVLIWEGFGCVSMWQGEHTSRAKAICLAIEAWANANLDITEKM